MIRQVHVTRQTIHNNIVGAREPLAEQAAVSFEHKACYFLCRLFFAVHVSIALLRFDEIGFVQPFHTSGAVSHGKDAG